ncbi:hypothetical protein GQ85_01315 [Rhodococcus rhodochrous]|nr:hypothetical protein GQ85_01315 [Rhodococcus rhodochrous]
MSAIGHLTYRSDRFSGSDQGCQRANNLIAAVVNIRTSGERYGGTGRLRPVIRSVGHRANVGLQ